MNFTTRWLRLFPCVLVSAGRLHAGDLADTPEFAHAMEVETVELGGFPVVFQYGDIRPDFEDTAPNPHRTRAPLDGPWSFRFDPAAEGIAGKWESAAVSEEWTQVEVPHCWDMMPGGRFWDWSDRTVNNPPFYDGAAWYRRDFEVEKAEGKVYRIEFLGVQQRARVFLNGRLLALHEGGGQPFSVAATAALRGGNNTLAVQVIRMPNFRPKADGKGFDEIETLHSQHPKAPDNWPYAGISRSVSLITEHSATLRKTQIRTRDGRLEAVVCVSNHGPAARDFRVGVSSPAAGPFEEQGIRLEPGAKGVLRFSAGLKGDAGKWSPETPVVHGLTATLVEDGKPVDTLRSSFGIRDFRVEGPRFLLNDKPVFLKGVAFYEEHPQRGNALTEADHRAHFKLAADARANFIRLHVGERDPLVYQLADRGGFMICGEWGGFWYKEKSMAAQSADARSIYQSHGRCAVWDLMNHPSVVIWGIHNESHQFCPEYETFVKTGGDLVRDHDWQMRPVTWAAWHPHQGQPHFEHSDAVGFNEYRGAMDPFEKLDPDLKRVTKENPGKPLVILENGGWSHRGTRGPKDQKGTEDWQADLMRRQHEVLVKHIPPLAGYTYWLLTDYRSRKTYTGNKRSDGWSRMGMYDEFGEAKLVRDVFRDLEWPLR